MGALLLFALVVGQAFLGSRPSWAVYVLFLALVPATGATLAARPAPLLNTWPGRGLIATLALASALVWLLPTLEARGWTLVAIGLAALTVTIAAAEDRRSARQLTLALIALGAVQALLGVIQTATGFDVLGDFREMGRIATGTFTNRNHLAGFLNIALALTLGQLYVGLSRRGWRRRSERWAWTWIYLLLGGFIGLGVLLSRSRAGVTTLFLTVTFVSCLMILRRRGRRRRFPVAIAWILLGVVVALGLAVGVDSLLARFTDVTSDARPEIFADTIDLITDHWLTGVGPGMYRWAFRPYQTVDLDHWYTHAHNDYLEITADFGVPLALALWGFVSWRLYRAARLAVVAERSAARGLALGAAGAIFSIAVHGLVDFNLQIPANLVAFTVVIGLAWSLERIEPRPTPNGWSLAIVLPILVLVLAAGWTSARRLSSEAYVRWHGGIEDLELAVTHAPDSPDAHHGLGRHLRDSPSDRDLGRAAVHLERAGALNPQSWQIQWELARLHELNARLEDAETAFESAIERNPRDGRYRWRLANFLLRQGRTEEALPEVRAALDAKAGLALPAWNLLTRMDLSAAELDRAWPDDPGSRLLLIRYATRAPESDHASFLLEQWSALLDTPEPPAIDEGAFFLTWLLRRGEEREARSQWLALSAANSREDPAYASGANAVWNSGFELEPTRSPFDWQLARGKGFSVGFRPGAAADRSSALHVHFDGSENLDRVLATQLVVLEPGTSYRFSYRARSAGISTDQGPVLEVVTRPTGTRLVAGEMLLGDVPWQNHEYLVIPPPDTHQFELRLRRRKSLRLDSKLRGNASFDSVRLERMPSR